MDSIQRLHDLTIRPTGRKVSLTILACALILSGACDDDDGGPGGSVPPTPPQVTILGANGTVELPAVAGDVVEFVLEVDDTWTEGSNPGNFFVYVSLFAADADTEVGAFDATQATWVSIAAGPTADVRLDQSLFAIDDDEDFALRVRVSSSTQQLKSSRLRFYCRTYEPGNPEVDYSNDSCPESQVTAVVTVGLALVSPNGDDPTTPDIDFELWDVGSDREIRWLTGIGGARAQVTGTLTFTEGSTSVTGAGTAFTTELTAGDFLQSDADGGWHVVDSITDDVTLSLRSVYRFTDAVDRAWAAGPVQNVRAELSTDGGATWTDILSSTPAADGVESWTVTGPITANALVRISDADAAVDPVSDVSDTAFTISGINITTPAAGATYNNGDPVVVTWLSEGVDFVDIDVTVDGVVLGGGPRNLANSNSYTWVADTVGSSCTVTVSSTAGAPSTTTPVFSVKGIVIEEPLSTSVWVRTSRRNVTWAAAGLGGTDVSIELSRDGGTTWSTIIASTPAAAGEYEWLVHGTAPAAISAFVRVSDATDASVSTTSDEFSILPLFELADPVLYPLANASLAWDKTTGLLAIAGYTDDLQNRTGAYIYDEGGLLPLRITSGASSYTSLPSLWSPPALDWADMDDDGDADLVLAGSDTGKVFYVFQYQGFVDSMHEFARHDLGDVYTLPVHGVRWGDFDNDGDQDLVVGGQWPYDIREPEPRPADNTVALVACRNVGGTFEYLDQIIEPITGVAIDLGDMDGDGYLDIAYVGMTDAGAARCGIKRYNPATELFENAFTLGAKLQGDVAWGDYDNDGDLDLAVSGRSSIVATSGSLVVYRNDWNVDYTFVEQGTISLARLYGSSIEWVDFDNDGDLDLSYMGSVGTTSADTGIYRNDGPGAGDEWAFVDVAPNEFDVVHRGQLGWHDFDGDGYPDLAFCGTNAAGTRKAKKLHNRLGESQ